MASINLGRVGYVHKGAYDPAAVYEKYDVVFYDHGSFLYIGESASGHSPLDPAYWQAMLDPAEMNAATQAALEAAERAENVASLDWDKMIPALTTPFSVKGGSVTCYPVSDALLKVTTRFYPRQEGKGEASPSNIRPVLPETELAFTHVKNGNAETHEHHLTNPSYGGAFLWYNGMVAENGVYKILNGQELGSDWAGWCLQTGDVAAQRYFYINIEARKGLDALDNVEEDGAIMSHFANKPEIRTSNTVQGFRFYNVRDGYTAHARLVVRPNMADFIGGSDAETLQNWKNWLAGQEAQGTPVQIAYQMMAGVAKKEGDGMEIRAGKGENRFQNNWRGDILTVSGPLDPAYQNAQQDERIEALEESAVSGGGSYTLPIATAETLGGVKVGDGLVVDADGKVSAEVKKEDVDKLSEEIDKLSGKEESIEVKIEATANDIIDGNFIGSNNEMWTSESYVCTKPIPISFNPGETLTVRCTIIGNAALVFLDNTQNVVLAINGTNASAHGITADVNLQIISISMPENAKYIRMSGLKTTAVTLKEPYTKPSDFWVSGLKTTNMSDMVAALESKVVALGDYIHEADLLYGKKLAVCGDSITEATNPDGGYFANYAEIVAARHNMSVYKDGKGGSTMTNIEGNIPPFSAERYLNVPSDFDILTIWFGWNDASYATIGTIDDTEDTTFYGAYKKVLEHFITTYPTKKIGLIVPYGNASIDPFRVAVRALSETYGVPCLDLADGKQCSLLWGTANAAQEARRAALTYDGTHPNQVGHEYLSTMYEEFIKRL